MPIGRDFIFIHISKLIAVAFFGLLAACQTTTTSDLSGDDAILADASIGPLHAEKFGRGDGEVIILLHGDVSSGGAADYLYGYASRLSAERPTATAYAVLRPGYYDRSGNRSSGSNTDRRDHYTSRNNRLVAQTITRIAAAHPGAKVTVMGHSGGAAQLGAIIGQYPGLIDKAVLVSCPCNITRWRQMRGRSAWTKSQSPHSFVSGIDPSTQVALIVGSGDSNTRPVLSSAYADSLEGLGVPVSLNVVAGAGHGFSGELSGAVLGELRK